MPLPEEFTKQMRRQLGEAEFALFEKAMGETPPVRHPVQPSASAVVGVLASNLSARRPARVTWSSDGFYLAGRPIFTLDRRYWSTTNNANFVDVLQLALNSRSISPNR